jgi:uncharacterized protein YjbI with pentapeptide repeats
MADIIITVVSGETTELGLSIPGVQGPIGGDTTPSGGVAGNILVKQSSLDYDSAWASQASGLTLIDAIASGVWINAGTISGGTYAGALFDGGTVSGATITSGTASDVAISSSLIDGSIIDNSTIEDSAIATTTISGCDIIGGTISGVAFSGNASILTAPQISGGTVELSSIIGATISGGTIDSPAIIGGTISGATFSGIINDSTITSPTISGGTIDGTVLTGVSINSPTISGGSIESPTLSGNASTGSGFVLGGSSDLLGFFGSSAVVQPSGIVIPSGGSSVDEVGTVVSGIIVALQSLGLLGV